MRAAPRTPSRPRASTETEPRRAGKASGNGEARPPNDAEGLRAIGQFHEHLIAARSWHPRPADADLSLLAPGADRAWPSRLRSPTRRVGGGLDFAAHSSGLFDECDDRPPPALPRGGGEPDCPGVALGRAEDRRDARSLFDEPDRASLRLGEFVVEDPRLPRPADVRLETQGGQALGRWMSVIAGEPACGVIV